MTSSTDYISGEPMAIVQGMESDFNLYTRNALLLQHYTINTSQHIKLITLITLNNRGATFRDF